VSAFPKLRTLQRWMAHVMAHPATADVALRDRKARALVPLGDALAGKVVKPNDRMTVAQRLQVYNDGYLARLKEVLLSDHKALQHLLGEREFHRLCARYVAAHPSTHPNLNQLDKALPAFVARQRGLRHRAFAAQLALFERRLSDAFDAPEFTPVRPERLAAIAPDELPRLVLTTNPSLQLCAFDWPVNDYHFAVAHDKSPRVPRPRRCWLAIYRREWTVTRQQLSAEAFAVLSALARGTPLGRTLARADDQVAVGRWFQEWAADGLFTGAKVRRTGSA
jgi:hypothetical protein